MEPEPEAEGVGDAADAHFRRRILALHSRH
jgi:hypothetical protein